MVEGEHRLVLSVHTISMALVWVPGIKLGSPGLIELMSQPPCWLSLIFKILALQIPGPGGKHSHVLEALPGAHQLVLNQSYQSEEATGQVRGNRQMEVL